MTESKPKLADINAMFSRCWGPLWDCLKVGGEKHGWESFRENDTELFINAGARHNTEVRKDQKSYDKDGFYHAAAVLANALMVLENVMRDIEEEEKNGTYRNVKFDEAQERGEYETEENLPSESKDEQQPMSFRQWATEQGYAAPVGDRYEGMLHPKYEGRIDELRALHQEYLSSLQASGPDAQAT